MTATQTAVSEMTYWRDAHLWFAKRLEEGKRAELLARYQGEYMTAEFHRKAAGDYSRWIEALEVDPHTKGATNVR